VKSLMKKQKKSQQYNKLLTTSQLISSNFL
jgi:hypothetical protein